MTWGTRVEIEYDTAIASTYVAQLNDDTKGLISSYMFPPFTDTYPYYIGGMVWVDQTNWVRSVSISRGKARFEDRMKVGNANIVFDNNTGRFGPYAYIGSTNPYALDEVPRRRIRISKYEIANPSNFYYVFTGRVTSWNSVTNIQGDDIMVVNCADAIADLSTQTISAQTFPSELSSARVSRILNLANVNWPADARSIETGTITLQGDTVADGTPVLDYLDIVARTEGGSFYIDAAGNFTFTNRNMASQPVIDMAGLSYGVNDETITNGYDNLYNQFILSRVGGGTVTVDDNTATTESGFPWGSSVIPGSQDRFGVITYEQPNLLFQTDAELETLGLAYAEWLGTVQQPLASMTIVATGYEAAYGDDLYGSDIGYASSAVPVILYLSSISHKISPDRHTITYGFAIRL